MPGKMFKCVWVCVCEAEAKAAAVNQKVQQK